MPEDQEYGAGSLEGAVVYPVAEPYWTSVNTLGDWDGLRYQMHTFRKACPMLVEGYGSRWIESRLALSGCLIISISCSAGRTVLRWACKSSS